MRKTALSNPSALEVDVKESTLSSFLKPVDKTEYDPDTVLVLMNIVLITQLLNSYELHIEIMIDSLKIRR